MTGRPSGKSPRSKESLQSKKTRSRTSSQEISKPLRGSQHLQDSTPKSESNSTKSKKSKGINSKGHSRTNGPSGKRVVCPKCGEYILKRVVRLHKKYYCGKQFEENEWKIVGGSALCLRCHKIQEPNSIEFHVKYLCGKKPITVQCFYCPLLIQDYKLLLGHMNGAHRKKHCFLDLISVLPAADFVGSANSTPKIVKNFFNMLHTEQEALVAENEVSSFVQLRYKTTHKCETCGKVILGSREYFNHVNTQCESVKCYACFYCDFKSALVYEVLDHMEDNHGKVFNTFDIIQARLTGIIPLSCQQPIDYVDKQNEPLESKTHSFPGENIKRSDETQDISKPALTKEKVSPANDDVTKKFEVVNGQMFVKGYPSQKESTVQEKLAHNSNVDIPKDTDPKQDVSGFNSVSIDDIQDRQFCPSSSLGKESENITMTQKEKLNELNVCSIKKRLSEETSVVPSTEPVFDANHSAFAESKSAENDLTELLLENDIVPQSMADDLKVDESLIECTSQEIQKPRFSPRTKLREVNINEGPKSPKQIKTIKSPSSVVVAENKCLNADPEVEFANNQLFEPYFSPSVVSQTIQNHVENSKRKNKSKFDKFKENSNLDENDSGKNMSSDSEVDFANNELFEPYVSPKKDLRSTRHKCAAVKNEKGIKVESLRKKGESSQTGKKVTKPQTDQIKLRKKFRNKVSLKVGKKKTVIGSLLKK